MAKVDLEQAIGDCIAMARAECVRLGVRLQEPPPEALRLSLSTDALRLRQVVDNLLSNAVKYTPAGGTVTLDVHRVDGEIELRVGDSGPGLDATRLAQIFTPFNRLGAERSGVPGSGLGLALTKALVEALQGRIRVESEPGRGSEFIVSLPGSPA
jgi:signal transduction histidine kinase